MKKLWIDFNEPDRSKFRITKDEVEFFKLELGEEILFYTEDIQVNAKVIYDKEQDQWFGQLITEIVIISKEIAEAREDGFENGRHFGQWIERDNIARKMKELKLPDELILKISNIDKNRLKNL
mgnify:CR=1 FL=1